MNDRVKNEDVLHKFKEERYPILNKTKKDWEIVGSQTQLCHMRCI